MQKKRTKKPPVQPETRREWLRRYEEGETPPKIAEADHFDVRTVRKNIEVARQEREQRETRVVVLRDALEKHYADLVGAAKNLDSELSGKDKILDKLREERMLQALKEHLPRAAIWKEIVRWDKIVQEIGELDSEIRKKIERDLIDGLSRNGELEGNEAEVIHDVALGLTHKARLLAHGLSASNLDLMLIHTKEGTVSIHFGQHYYVGTLLEERAGELEKVINQTTTEITAWEEYEALKRHFRELEKLRNDVKEELAVIIYRRVVPGRCRYCPA
jgi:hypothetical protein